MSSIVRVLARPGKCSDCNKNIPHKTEQVVVVNSSKHRKIIILCAACTYKFYKLIKGGIDGK